MTLVIDWPSFALGALVCITVFLALTTFLR